jgi:hypothetical protein
MGFAADKPQDAATLVGVKKLPCNDRLQLRQHQAEKYNDEEA